MNFTIELEQETDGRWIAEISELSGVLVYGQTRGEAMAKAQALALRVQRNSLNTEKPPPDLMSISFHAA